MGSVKVGTVTVDIPEHNSLETLVRVTKESNRNVFTIGQTQLISGVNTIFVQFVHYHRLDLQ